MKTSIDQYTPLNLPAEPKEERLEKFLKAMEDSLKKDKNGAFWLPYNLAMEMCAACNTCAEACHIYLASDKKDIYNPVTRSNMLRKVHKRYFTLAGKLLKGLVGAEDLTEEKINELAESLYRCSLCRRCAVVCPIGIDNALMVREGRKILNKIGIAPKELREQGTDLQLKVGNATDTPTEAFKGIIEFMEQDIKDRTGKDIKFPLDKKGAEYLIMNNAGDYLAFIEDIMAQAEVLTAANVDWTINTRELGTNDVVNYGAFFDDERLVKVMKEHFQVAKKLGAKKLVVGECGHAYKVLKHISERLLPEKDRVEVLSILELTDRLIREGKIKLDPSKNPEPITFHDSCNLARMGGLFDEPRRILKAACKDVREMYPNRELNYCCGGGGGAALMNSGNFMEWKMKIAGKLKADQIKATGAKVVVSSCANCKSQLREMINYYKLDVDNKGVHEMVARALVV